MNLSAFPQVNILKVDWIITRNQFEELSTVL